MSQRRCLKCRQMQPEDLMEAHMLLCKGRSGSTFVPCGINGCTNMKALNTRTCWNCEFKTDAERFSELDRETRTGAYRTRPASVS